MRNAMHERSGGRAPAAALTALLALALACWACTPGASEPSGAPAEAAGFQEDPNFVLDGDATRATANYGVHCASCHGAAGDGAGPVGSALQPPPTDFTAARVPTHRAWVAVRDGGMAVGKAATMPGFASAFSEQEIHDMVDYIQAFAD